MAGVPTEDLKPYFAEAKRWDQDRLRSAQRSRALAWTIAAVAGACAVAGVVAVAMLTPLKTVEPYVIRVNETTGQVDIATALTGTRELTYNEAVTKFFMAQYVRSREGYQPQAAEEEFRQVTIMSTPEEQQRWADTYRSTNPQSPQVLFANGQAVVTIKTIAFVNDEVASVRFTRTATVAQQVIREDWIATIGFNYTEAPMSEGDRLRNPLGFQVNSYRADPETVQ